jgi:hypothetical protein
MYADCSSRAGAKPPRYTRWIGFTARRRLIGAAVPSASQDGFNEAKTLAKPLPTWSGRHRAAVSWARKPDD